MRAGLDYEGALRAGLARLRLPTAPATLTLVRLNDTTQTGQVQLNAVVRLDWAPGMRQHVFSTTKPDPERAVEALLEQVADRFTKDVRV